jgi:serpin B
MRKRNAFSLVLGAALLTVLNGAPRSSVADPVDASLVASNTAFALSMFDQMAARQPAANIFFSPYSISTCLGMLYAGARGNTASQMAEALDFSTNQAAVGPEFGALQADLNAQGTNGIDLSVANGLWAQANYPFLMPFLANASTNYDASVQSVNFITNSPQICAQINEWVAEKTDGMIANLLPPGTLNATVRLVLVDAIYFKGGWASIFNTNATTTAPFFNAAGQIVYVPMMEQTGGFQYYEDSLLQAVEFPYTNTSVAMLVLLPETDGPVSLTPTELSMVLGGLAPQFVDLKLPKFKLNVTTDLVPLLKNLGMSDAFSPGAADFSGIDGATDLFVAKAVHEAVVEVDETGTTAAGATGIIGASGAVVKSIPFQADHPFVFLIRDTSSGSILFMGLVDDPTVGGAAGAPPSAPLIQTSGGSFGLKNHQFGFNVVSTNATLVVEACTNIAGGAWTPLQTLTLTNGSAYFSEPMPTNSASRFYRVKTQ